MLSNNSYEGVTTRLKCLRDRAGISMEKIAKPLGLASASSYQHYEDDKTFTREHLPLHMVEKLLQILPGRGDPPVTASEVLSLGGLADSALVPLKSINAIRSVPVIGSVATNNWKDHFERPRAQWDYEVDSSGETSKLPKYAVRVDDASFSDFMIAKGSTAFFHRLSDLGSDQALQDGSLVIVIRQIGTEPRLTEATIMEFLRLENDRCALAPADSSREWVHSHSQAEFGDSIRILGHVFHSTTPHANRKRRRNLGSFETTTSRC